MSSAKWIWSEWFKAKKTNDYNIVSQIPIKDLLKAIKLNPEVKRETVKEFKNFIKQRKIKESRKKWYKNYKIIAPLIIGICTIIAALIERVPIPNVDKIAKTKLATNNLTLTPEIIDKLTAKVIRWRDYTGGDRASYEILLSNKNKSNTPEIAKLLSSSMKNIENNYASDVMAYLVARLPAVNKFGCPPNPHEWAPITGFNARSVMNHLTRYYWTERARAARLLANIKTATDRNQIDKLELYNKLTKLMEEDEISLVASKMALNTYSQLVGFKPSGVFDFEGAIKDWKTLERRKKILKADF